MSIQFETQRLLSENPEMDIKFVVKNEQLESLLKTYFSEHLSVLDKDTYSLDTDTYREFQNLSRSSGYDEETDYFELDTMEEEGSTTSSSGAYAASLHASPKKYKGPELKEAKDKEPKLAAGKAKVYMKSKWGWKDAPSIPNRKSKAIDYKKLFEREITKGKDADGKEVKIGDDVEVLLFKDGRGVVTGFEKDKVFVTVKSGGGSTYERPNVPMFAKNIKKIEKDKKEDKKEDDMEKQPEKGINESYSKFVKETKTRSKPQQFYEAAKLVDKKLKEINKLLEYTSKLKGDLFEDESCEDCGRRTSKVMERITKNIAEAYKKTKKIK